MENKKIALPYSIQEFYVDCNNKKFERTLSKNKTEFDDLCRAINHLLNNGNKKDKNKKVNNIDILELNDEIEKCMNIMIKKEGEKNNLYEKIKNIEKNDNKIFKEIKEKRKLEVKKKNQEKIRETLKNNELEKIQKAQERINKIIFQKRKCEPPLYFQKKEVKEKVDENQILQDENEELLIYQ